VIPDARFAGRRRRTGTRNSRSSPRWPCGPVTETASEKLKRLTARAPEATGTLEGVGAITLSVLLNPRQASTSVRGVVLERLVRQLVRAKGVMIE
jgi:hypothetical protein